MAQKELETFITTVISFILVGIIITVGSIVITSVGDTTKSDFILTQTDEQITATNGSQVDLDRTDITGITSIENASNGVVLLSGNFTLVDLSAVLFDMDGNASEGTFLGFSGHTVNVTYNYHEQGAWYNATLNDGADAMSNISGFLPTIAIVLVSMIILLIVLGAFVFFRNR